MAGEVFAIDGTNQLHRYWHGASIHAAAQFLGMVDAIDATYRPRKIVCAFDSEAKTFRHELEPGYKSGRPAKEAGLLDQIQAGIDGLMKRKIACIAVAGFEADDILATVARLCRESDQKLVLVTSDKDCRQLLSSRCVMLTEFKAANGGREPTWFNEQALSDKYGVRPDQWIDWQAMVGDPTDTVIGIEGIGAAGASRLLKQGESLDAIIANPWSVTLTPKQQEHIAKFKARLPIVRQLVTLRDDVPIGWEL